MTGPPDDHIEQRLRDILHAEVDTVQPSGDGLERIRERTALRGFSWLTWLRPATAVAASIAIITAIVMGTPALREHIAPSFSTTEPTPSETHAGAASPPAPTPADSEAIEEPASPQATDEPGPTTGGGESAPEDPEETQLSATSPDDCPPGQEPAGTNGDASDDEDDDAAEECVPAEEDDDDEDEDDDPTESPSPQELVD
jgi:hypothetical protein